MAWRLTIYATVLFNQSNMASTSHDRRRGHSEVGETRLHKAIDENDLTAVQLLIEEGVDVNAIHDNMTPLLASVYEKNIKIAEELIDAGADVNLKVPLKNIWFFDEKDMEKIIKLMIKNDLDFNAIDDDPDEGRAALHEAIINGDPYFTEFLLKYGADANVRDRIGDTALHYSAYRHESEFSPAAMDNAKLLINAGADVNAKTKEGKTALHIAATRNDLTFATYLVEEAGADVNIANDEGNLFWSLATDKAVRRSLMELYYFGHRPSDREKKLSELRRLGGDAKEIDELSKMSDKEFEEVVGKKAMDQCTNDMDHLFLGTWEASDFRNTVFLRVTDKFGKQRTYCMVERFYEGEEYRGKRTPDLDANISSAFKDIFFSDWVYKYDAGSERELREMRKVMEEEEEADKDKHKIIMEKLLSLGAEKNKLEKEIEANYSFFYSSTKYLKLVEEMKKKKEEFEKAKEENLKYIILNVERKRLRKFLKKSNRTAEEEAELLKLGKRLNGLSDKEHKAGDAYSSADAYGRSGKAGRPGQKRYVIMKLTNGVDFYVEWDDLLKQVVKRKKGYVDNDNYYRGRREADVTSFELPDNWSLPIAIYITQEEEPIAIGNEKGSRGSSESHGNKVVSVYKVRRIVNFETYDSIDGNRECLGEDCLNSNSRKRFAEVFTKTLKF